MSFATSTGSATDALPRTTDYILWYAKNVSELKFHKLFGDQEEAFSPAGSDERGDFELASMTSQDPSETRSGPIKFRGETFSPSEGRHWSFDPDVFPRLVVADRVVRVSDRQVRWKKYKDERVRGRLGNRWDDTQFAGFSSDKIYVVQTHRKVVERCVLMTTDPGDLILDPTCGSGTTGYVAEQLGRRWITIDTSRVSITLARARLMAARFPYFLLDDSADGARKEAEITGKLPPDRKYDGDIRQGFVYKRVPHVTLKAIANNAEIDEIHGRWQKKMEPVREKLTLLRKTSWKEWEIPREAGKDWPKEAKAALEEWWRLRQERQKEIDASIARQAETERLYDQPYEDKKKIRVTGPFTVESLSPHRMLEMDHGKDAAAQAEESGSGSRGQFVTMILDNLKTAGVQNTKKKERLKFSRLEPHAGTWVHAVGEYMEGDKTRTVAVFIGPEHGTVGPEMVREAAKEAVQGIGFDTLIACGFAFDPHVSEEATRFGKLTVLIARMNPDLAMGQDLLKKTGAGNLFMVFGEPDLKVSKGKDGKLTVEVRGVGRVLMLM